MNESIPAACGTTYHTPRADGTYEQCPWVREHVEAIYRNLAGRIVEDGQWHEILVEPGRVGRYRVFENRYFQAVYARELNPVYEALTAMDPVVSEDDAEWAIWQEEVGAYAISSTFALTPGVFEHQPAVDEWLWRHGLGLEPNEFFVEGIAYFTDIEPGCLLDAMERLRWLERAFRELNERLEEAGREFWQTLKAESDAVVERLGHALAPDEIAPLPDCYPRLGWKYRQSIPQEEDVAPGRPPNEH